MTVKNEAVVSTVKKHKEPLFRLVKRTDIPIWKKWVIRIVAFMVAAIAASLLFTFIIGDGAAFGTFFKELWKGSFGTERLTYIFLNNWAIMMCISLAVTPAFKMRFWNIGAEGQTLAAALGAAFVIHYFGKTLIEPVVILLMLVAALFMGMLWALIPAIFKAIWGTNETLFTLMMNYVAIQLVSFFVNLWSPGGSGTIGNLGKGSFHGLFGLPYIQNAVFVAIVTIIIFIYLKFFKHGYELEVVGESVNTAKYIGINVKKVIIRTMILSGAVCGFAGFLLVGGSPTPTINTGLVGGRGFTAILVSWLSKFSPIAMIFVAALVVFLQKGASQASDSFHLGASSAFSNIIIGIFFLMIIACEFFIDYQIKFRKKEGK